MHVLDSDIFLVEIILLLFRGWLKGVGGDFDASIFEVESFPVGHFAGLALLQVVGGHVEQKVPNGGIHLGVRLELVPITLSTNIEHILLPHEPTILLLLLVQILSLAFVQNELVENYIKMFDALSHFLVHRVQMHNLDCRGRRLHLVVDVDQKFLKVHLSHHSHQFLQSLF